MKSILFPNSVFHFNFLYSFLIVKFVLIKKPVINRVLQFYLFQMLFSIIFWIPF